MPNPQPLVAEELSVRLAGGIVLDRLSLSVSPGECVAIVGGNGSGKSTLLRALLGLVPARSRTLTVDGITPSTAALWRRIRRRCAWVPQASTTSGFPITGRELLGGRVAGHLPLVADELQVAHLLPRPLAELSGGQRQRIMLARAFGALQAEAVLLLADEPTTGLDAASRDRFFDLLTRAAPAALVVTHDTELAARCHRRYELVDGALVDAS